MTQSATGRYPPEHGPVVLVRQDTENESQPSESETVLQGPKQNGHGRGVVGAVGDDRRVPARISIRPGTTAFFNPRRTAGSSTGRPFSDRISTAHRARAAFRA